MTPRFYQNNTHTRKKREVVEKKEKLSMVKHVQKKNLYRLCIEFKFRMFMFFCCCCSIVYWSMPLISRTTHWNNFQLCVRVFFVVVVIFVFSLSLFSHIFDRSQLTHWAKYIPLGIEFIHLFSKFNGIEEKKNIFIELF